MRRCALAALLGVLSLFALSTPAAPRSGAAAALSRAEAPDGSRDAQTLPDTPAISIAGSAQRLRLLIPIPRRGDLAIDLEGAGVVVRFPGTFDTRPLENLGERFPGWIQDLRYGYDSLYLEPAAGVDVELGAAPGVHEVILVRRPREEAGDAAARRLARLDAVSRGRGGDPAGARARLRGLMEAQPDDVEVLVDLIEQERALGDWRDALALYGRALARDAAAPFLVEGKAALLYEHGPMLRTSFEYSDVSGEDRQLIGVIEGRTFAAARTVAGLRFEYRDVDDPQVQNPAGFVAAFSARRELASVYLEQPLGRGEGRLEVLEGAGRPGLSLAWQLGWNPGETRLALDAWRPYWDFVEGIAHGGYRHRLELRHRPRLDGPWALEFALDASRYGLTGDAEIADAWGAQLAVARTLWAAEPRLTVEYYFDTERFGNVRERFDGAGRRYAPIGFNDREVHQFQLAWEERITDYLRVAARGGYTIDRYNGRGRHLAADLSYEPLPGLEIGLRYSQSITSARGGANRLDSFGGFLMLRL